MTLLQFIDSKLDEETPVGDLANDAKKDSKFQTLKNDKDRLEYLSESTHAIREVYKDFLKEFKLIKDNE
ncbi:MAG: hypothetical protein ABIP27_06020 [Flavobacterium circumlabens]|uniref:hypothetical protein n=1 Tax=Flavobacterium TaxID=237 RepID=UPI0012B13397|nr:hypothetical protein [Flavobacterium sp. LC2016-23]MRX42051.1 hypothetical protein [Flavobacterium sp. LC2016-23]